jgi:uracil-xanthine permease
MAIGWKLHGDGRTLAPGDVVAPDERLGWGRTVGLGAQHVVAMFGATFVFPLIMGLNPQLAIMMSGIATIIFLLIVQGKVPSYLGTSAAFVGGVAAIRAQGGNSQQVTGAILIAGLVLAAVGVIIHFAGSRVVYAVLPPAVTGAVVMLIGFNLAPVVASVYWPQDQGIALLVMLFVIVVSLATRGFISRIAIFLALVFGYVLSWGADKIFGQITSYDAAAGKVTTHYRVSWTNVDAASWLGFPPATGTIGPDGKPLVGYHAPSFSLTFILLVLPAVIALIAENTGHVKAVAEMTGANLDPYMGRAIAADGIGTAVASSVGGSPTTTYAENIGVMAATRVYSTAAYWVAALVAIVLGLSPKIGAAINTIPAGVLGGVTTALYGLIGIIGVKIWLDNKVDFGKPQNQFTAAIALIIGISDLTFHAGQVTLGGIAIGSVAAIVVYHLMSLVARWRGTAGPPADNRQDLEPVEGP